MKKILILLFVMISFISIGANASVTVGHLKIANFTEKPLTVKWQDCRRPVDNSANWNCQTNIKTTQLAALGNKGSYKEVSTTFSRNKEIAFVNLISATQVNGARGKYDKTCSARYFTKIKGVIGILEPQKGTLECHHTN